MTEDDISILEKLVVHKVKESKEFRVPSISVVMYLDSVLKKTKLSKKGRVNEILKGCVDKDLIQQSVVMVKDQSRCFYSVGL